MPPSPPPRRSLALWFPFLPTDRLRRSDPAVAPDDSPLALVERVGGALRLAATDRAARQAGLLPGLTLADARARVPHLVTAAADPLRDAGFLGALARRCEGFTPLVAPDAPDGLLLDITGCDHLFGGEAGLRAALRAMLAAEGVALRASIAGTAPVARMLARFGRTAIARPGEDEALLRPLPIAALDLPAEAALALTRAGLVTLGDVLDCPAASLAARFGADLPARLRRALGVETAPMQPLRAAIACRAERRFAEPLVQTEALEITLAALIDEVVEDLTRRGAGGRIFEACFHRCDGVLCPVVVETGQPQRDAAAIARLFREKLETLSEPLDAGFGFDAVSLHVSRHEALGALQRDLDGKAREETTLADLVERLSQRLGPARVQRFAPRETHDPARAFRRITAAGAPAARMPWPRRAPGEPPDRPLQLLDPPQLIDTLAEVPDGAPRRFRWRSALHDIRLAEGPERIAPEWWRAAPWPRARDYYRLEDAQGRRFWVFRDGLHAEGTEPPRWYLHGFFA